MRTLRKTLPLLAALLFFCGFALPSADELERRVCESLLNTALRDLFSGTLKIEHAHVGRDLRLRLSGLSGELITKERPVRIEMGELKSADPLYRVLFF